jgi:xylulokinase
VDDLDIMCLNWGPYLLMRCYSNGAGVLNRAVGAEKSWQKSDWEALEAEARAVPAGSHGHRCLPLLDAEPSLGIDNHKKGIRWLDGGGRPQVAGSGPEQRGLRRRASLEAVACDDRLGGPFAPARS